MAQNFTPYLLTDQLTLHTKCIKVNVTVRNLQLLIKSGMMQNILIWRGHRRDSHISNIEGCDLSNCHYLS